MIPNDLRTKLDTLLENTATEVAGVQEDYRTLHGRYWQGARTHAAPPADGATVAPDLTRKPADEAASWGSMGLSLPEATEGAFSVDIYQARHGHGWVINAEVIAGGIHYRRAVNHGPERWRGHDWKAFKQTTM